MVYFLPLIMVGIVGIGNLRLNAQEKMFLPASDLRPLVIEQHDAPNTLISPSPVQLTRNQAQNFCGFLDSPDVAERLSSAALQYLHSKCKKKAKSAPLGQINLDSPRGSIQNETTIAVSDVGSGIRMVAGWNDLINNNSRVGYAVSIDGGTTWLDKGQLPLPGKILPGFNAKIIGDPVVAVDSNGRFYMVSLCVDELASLINIFSSICISYSNLPPAQPAFVSTIRIITGASLGGTTFLDKPWIAIDRTNGPCQGKIYVTFTLFSQLLPGLPTRTAIFLVRLSPGAPPTVDVLNQISLDGNNVQGSSVAVGPGTVSSDGQGEVVVAWEHYSPGDRSIHARSDTSACGEQFGPELTLVTLTSASGPYLGKARSNEFPSVAIAQGVGFTIDNVLIAYSSASGVDPADIFAIECSDPSLTDCFGSGPVNDSPVGSTEFFPSAAISGDGNIAGILYYTNRESASFDTDNLSVFLAQFDGGLGFQCTPSGSSTKIAPNGPGTTFNISQSPGNYWGDYIQAVGRTRDVTSNDFYMVWGDDRWPDAGPRRRSPLPNPNVRYTDFDNTNCGKLIADSVRIIPLNLDYDYSGTANEKLGLGAHGTEILFEVTNAVQLSVQIFNLGGKLIFNESTTDNRLVFKGLDRYGRPLSNGVYLYIIVARRDDGTIFQSNIKKLIVLR
jgi:hypothetical protein